MIARRLGAIGAVSILVLLSMAVGPTSAYAAIPAPPTIDSLFTPWITSADQRGLQGNKDADVTQIDITVSNDEVSNAPYCTIPTTVGATVWFNCEPTTATLALGDNYLAATATNGDGTSVPGPSILITRVAAPTIASPADEVYTNDSTPDFSGTADPATTTVSVVVPGLFDFCSAAPVTAGVWSCAADIGPVADGDYEYFAMGDPGDGVGSETRVIHIDTTDPGLTDITGPPGTEMPSGTLFSSTSDSTPTITGTGEPFARIKMYQNYTEIACVGGPPVVDAGGSWSCTLAVPLPTSGVTYVFGSNQFDRAGNPVFEPSPDEQLNLTFTDNVPPDPPVITAPIDAEFSLSYSALTNDPAPTVSGTGEPGAHLNLTVDGGTYACSDPVTVAPDGTWACSIPGLTDGVYTVDFTLTDPFGNTSPPAAKDLQLTIDTTPPDSFELWTPVGSFAAGVTTATTTSTHPFLSGAGEYGASLQIYLDGSTPVTCQEGPPVSGEGGFGCTVAAALAPGVHEFGFSQTDAAGNSSGAPVVRLRLTVLAPPSPPVPTAGTVPPVVLSWLLAFTADNDSPTAGQNVVLTGSDLPAGSEVFAELHSTPTPLGTTTVLEDGTFRLNTVIPNTVEPGQHHYVVTVTPADGDPQTTSMPVTVLPAPPVVILPPDPAPEPPGALPSPTAGGGAGPVSRDQPDAPNTLGATLPTLHDVISDPLVLGSAAVSSLALLFLVAIPAELLNSTLDENYERLFGRIPKPKLPWLQRLRERTRSKPLVGGLVLTALAAFVMSFSDPAFGLDLASLRLFLACLVGMFVLGFVANAITGAIIGRRWSIGSVIELQPIGIAIALVGVLLSRLLDFAPGLLVGLVLTLSLSASATARDEARYVLTWFGVVLGISLACWLAYSLAGGIVAPGTFGGALVDDALAAVATEGISALLIGLLPLGYFDGRALFHHSKAWWLGTYLVTLVAFFVVVVPSGALWGDIRGPFWLWITVFLVFAALCVGVFLLSRALDRRRETRETADAAADDAAAQPEPAAR